MLQALIVDDDDALIVEDTAGEPGNQEGVVGTTNGPAEVGLGRGFVTDGWVHRPLAQPGRQRAQQLHVARRLAGHLHSEAVEEVVVDDGQPACAR